MEMKARTLERRPAWDVSPRDAIQIQAELRPKVCQSPLGNDQLHSLAGIDVGFPRGKDVARAAVVVLAFPSLHIIDQAVAEMPVTFPYVPGLAPPRRFGLACHLGVLLDLPAIGCAKSILVGKHGLLGAARGSTAELLVDEMNVVGMAVHTRDGVKPVYISVGYRVDLPSAVAVALACGRGYRLPEPTRLAHHLASQTV